MIEAVSNVASEEAISAPVVIRRDSDDAHCLGLGGVDIHRQWLVEVDLDLVVKIVSMEEHETRHSNDEIRA